MEHQIRVDINKETKQKIKWEIGKWKISKGEYHQGLGSASRGTEIESRLNISN